MKEEMKLLHSAPLVADEDGPKHVKSVCSLDSFLAILWNDDTISLYSINCDQIDLVTTIDDNREKVSMVASTSKGRIVMQCALCRLNLLICPYPSRLSSTNSRHN